MPQPTSTAVRSLLPGATPANLSDSSIMSTCVRVLWGVGRAGGSDLVYRCTSVMWA